MDKRIIYHGSKQFVAEPELKICKFNEMSEEWLDFIIACRRGVPHGYDIVEGSMADEVNEQ